MTQIFTFKHEIDPENGYLPTAEPNMFFGLHCKIEMELDRYGQRHQGGMMGDVTIVLTDSEGTNLDICQLASHFNMAPEDVIRFFIDGTPWNSEGVRVEYWLENLTAVS